jgi:ATP-dependent helicase/nuclease subunit B
VSHPFRTIDTVTLTAVAVRPAEALDELARSIEGAKGDDRLAPVTVVVPTNTCGVMARRALGRRVGIVGVDMVTLNRLAELIAGPGLAASGRSPMSSSLVDLAVARALDTQPGSFSSVAGHPTTIVALRRLHEEVRLAGPEITTRLAHVSSRAQEALRVSRAVTALLEADWYDEADLFRSATHLISTGAIPPLPPIVVHLPHDLAGLAVEFIRALATRVPVRVLCTSVGRELDGTELDGDARDLFATLGVDAPVVASSADRVERRVKVVSTTDADDEVRHAARAVLDAARSGVAFERIAVLWPSQRPYARLVEHHLTVAGIPWNGRPGTAVVERLAPRLVLDLLDIDRRGLRRHGFFSLVADVPPADPDGGFWPTAAWERTSRQAGVARDDDWNIRLGSLVGNDRWGESAASLLAFVNDLRSSLGHPKQQRPWSEWSQWCVDQLDGWVGRARLERLPEIEYRAWEALTAALDRLRHLDPGGDPVVTRHRFRAALESELDAVPGRVGRVGDGVTVGSLAGALGLDIDVAIVVGAAEGTLPPRPLNDPLLSDADRAAAGLAQSDAAGLRMHRALLALDDTATITFTVPRGDLRSTAHLERSRWLDHFAWRTDDVTVPSHTAGLAVTEFPTNDSEHRLRSRYTHVRAGGAIGDAIDVSADAVLLRALTMTAARASADLTPFDGDLSSVTLPRVDGVISPSQLEAWVACPHAYFLQHLLHVHPIDEPADQISISAADIGTTQHRALDRFHRAVIAGDLPQPTTAGWTDEHRDALTTMFDEECRLAERRGRTGRTAYWSDERARMRADLLGWLERDSELAIARGITVLASEQRFGNDAEESVELSLGDGRTLRMRGTVDRIDRTAAGTIVVTDHKSGAGKGYKGLGPDDPTLGATVFQLPAYAAAARRMVGDADVEVRAEYGLMGKGGYERHGYTLTPDVVDLVGVQLARVVDGIEAGWFPNRPVRPGWHLYVACPYCEPDSLGTAERWGEWLRKQHDPRLATWFGSGFGADEPTPGDTSGDGPDDV